MEWRKLWNLAKKLYVKFAEDDIPALGAQVTYYLILSFFPFLIFIVTIISYTNITNTEFLNMISGFLPNSVYKLILDLIGSVIRTRNKAFISLGMLGTIWSASTGVLAFMYGMNKAYKKKETRPFWKVRALSVLFTLALSIIIIFSIVLIVFGEMLGKHFSALLGSTELFNTIWDMLRYVISVATLFIVFMLFYLFIPNYRLRVKDVLPGAVLSTAGWIVLSVGFAFYMNNFSNVSRIYGSIGAVIALLIWLYWSSILVFIGSELNALLSKKNK